MIKKALHFALVWLTTLCVAVQGAGSFAGRVLCVGCADLGGVNLASTPCGPADDCCGPAGDETPAPHGDHDDDAHQGCGCFDVPLPAGAGTVAQPPATLAINASHWASLPAAMMPAVEPAWLIDGKSARAGPEHVRLLAPAARQTILLL